MVPNLLITLCLPLLSYEAFVGKDVTTRLAINYTFGSQTLICTSWNQVIDKWHAIERGNRDQLVAKIVHLLAGTIAIVWTAEKITPFLASSIAYDKY